MRIIRGKYGRRRFNVPTNITARPTTDFARENIFNVIENLTVIEGARVADLFAGTGAVSFEFLSRDAASVVSVEKAPVQYNFIRKVAAELNDGNISPVRGDVFRFIATAPKGAYDIVFADPPYDLPDFEKVVPAVLASGMMAPGGFFIIEHSKKRDYSSVPGFIDHRAYGSVNFSIFRIPEGDDPQPIIKDENPTS